MSTKKAQDVLAALYVILPPFLRAPTDVEEARALALLDRHEVRLETLREAWETRVKARRTLVEAEKLRADLARKYGRRAYAFPDYEAARDAAHEAGRAAVRADAAFEVAVIDATTPALDREKVEALLAGIAPGTEGFRLLVEAGSESIRERLGEDEGGGS